jgi:Raf kinase inhibitor-like YbhB/YbcL family protein
MCIRVKIETDAILNNGHFDARYTCDIDNSSPELRWDDAPPGIAGFAILAIDLDHPEQKCHWCVFNIPPTVFHLPAGIPPQELLPNGIRQGLNSWGKLGYAGPCPPMGSEHRYQFKLYALAALPELKHRASSEELLQAITPYIVETAEIVGRYQRMMQIAG